MNTVLTIVVLCILSMEAFSRTSDNGIQKHKETASHNIGV